MSSYDSRGGGGRGSSHYGPSGGGGGDQRHGSGYRGFNSGGDRGSGGGFCGGGGDLPPQDRFSSHDPPGGQAFGEGGGFGRGARGFVGWSGRDLGAGGRGFGDESGQGFGGGGGDYPNKRFKESDWGRPFQGRGGSEVGGHQSRERFQPPYPSGASSWSAVQPAQPSHPGHQSGGRFQPPYPSGGSSGSGDPDRAVQPVPALATQKAGTADAVVVLPSNSADRGQEIIPFWDDYEKLEQLLDEMNVDRGISKKCVIDYGSDYGERVTRAIEETLEASRNKPAQQEQYEEESDDDSEASSLDCRIGPPLGPPQSSAGDYPQEDKACRKLVQALAQCPSMNLGFHIMPLFPEDDKACRCPFSKMLQGWREKSGLQQDLHVPSTECRSSGTVNPVYTPNAFIAHLRAKKGCRWHDTVYLFLEKLYKDYVIEGMLHRAFYCLGDDNFKKVVSAEQRKKYRLVEAMKEDLAAAKEEAAKAAERQKVLQKLAKVNEGLSRRLALAEKNEKLLKERLGIRESDQKHLTETDLEMFSKMYQKERELWRITESLNQLTIGKEKENNILISVKVGFKLNTVFKNWEAICTEGKRDGKTHEYYLFCDDLTNEVGSRSFFNQWKVGFAEEKRFYDKNNQMQAKDEGGPTRQFLSEVWGQMNTLSVRTSKGEEMKLFEMQENFMHPRLDYYIEKLGRKEREKTMRYYRAIGRILAYCIIHGFSIPEQALPPIHRAYLIQDLNPTSKKYPLHQLFQDFSRMKGELTYELSKDTFRDSMKEMYIDGRIIALNSLREGITLNGQLGTAEIFSNFPQKAIDFCLFGKQEIKLQDLVKVLYPDYMKSEGETLYIQSEVLKRNEIRKEAEGVFVDVLRDLEDEHPDFIRQFVFFVTGYKFLPYGTDFKIIVEFNNDEERPEDSFPTAHTCNTSTLVLPEGAYEGRKELLKEKLEICVSYLSGGSFQME